MQKYTKNRYLPYFSHKKLHKNKNLTKTESKEGKYAEQ